MLRASKEIRLPDQVSKSVEHSIALVAIQCSGVHSPKHSSRSAASAAIACCAPALSIGAMASKTFSTEVLAQELVEGGNVFVKVQRKGKSKPVTAKHWQGVTAGAGARPGADRPSMPSESAGACPGARGGIKPKAKTKPPVAKAVPATSCWQSGPSPQLIPLSLIHI